MAKVLFGEIVKEVKNIIDRRNNPYEFYIAGEHMDTEELKIKRKGRFATDDVGPAFIREFKKGQVLYGSRRTYLKKVAVADFNGITSNTTFVLETKNNEIFIQKLLPFLMLSDSFTNWSINKSKGSTNPYVLFSDLAQYTFELPSMEKQKELAQILWAAEETKQAYKTLLQKTDDLIKARFEELFGTIGKNEKGWGITTLGKCCELNPIRPKNIDNNQLVSFIPMQAVTEKGYINCSTIKKYKEVKSGYTYFAENDVLFAKITPCMENGKGAIAKGLTGGIGFGSTEFYVLRPIEKKSNPYWLYFITVFSSFRINARKIMTGTGGQLRVPISYLETFPISLPPIELQESFETFVQQAEQSKQKLQKALELLNATTKSLINEHLK